MPIALQAFLDYQPLIPPRGDPTRLYRSVRWGKHVELFVLDTRQYRDADRGGRQRRAPQDDARRRAAAPGSRQALARSDATWKVHRRQRAAVDPDRHAPARDGFADGGTADRLRARGSAHLPHACAPAGSATRFWITTDVHFATGFVYRPFADDPAWTSYEFISGPLNAGIFPEPGARPDLPPRRLFFYAPRPSTAIARSTTALGWFNFGVVDVDADGTLTVSIVNGRGETVFRYTIAPA